MKRKVQLKRIPKSQSYYLDDIDDGHSGVAILSGKDGFLLMTISNLDYRKAVKAARYFVKKMANGGSIKVRGTYKAEAK